MSFCRELQTRGTCARGNNCNFAHSDDELEHYRAKYKKNALKNIIPINQQLKESSSSANAVVSNGPNLKVNMNHPNFAKCPPPNDTNSSSSSRMINSKSIPYRSETSLHHSPLSQTQNQHQQSLNHLRPSNVYNSTASSNASSCSTPNLSQLQLSPNQIVTKPSQQQQQQQQGSTRFSFNGTNRGDPLTLPVGQFMNSNFNQRPPMSTTASIGNNNNNNNNNNYKKQMSPYHNSMMPPHIQQQRTQQQQQGQRMHPMNNGNGNGNAYYGQNPNSSSTIYRNGSETNGKYMQWQQQQQQQQRSPVSTNLYNPNKASKPAVVNGNSSTSRQMQFPCEMDEVDGPNGNNLGNMKSAAAAATQASAYPFSSPKEKFIRSYSILATNHTDENYENFTSNGKYGAIGIRSNDTLQGTRPQSQWSGLQDSFVNLNISNESFDMTAGGSGGVGNNNMSSNSGNALKIIDSLNKNDDSTHHHYGLNGNFLNIQVSRKKSFFSRYPFCFLFFL